MMNSKYFEAALDSVTAMGRKPFKATYEVWDTDLGYWRHCEFHLFASNFVAAERLAKTYCRDKNGQPIDYHNLEVQALV